MRKAVLCIITVISAVFLAGRAECAAQEIAIPIPGVDTLHIQVPVVQQVKSVEEKLKAKLDSLRQFSTPALDRADFAEEGENAAVQSLFDADSMAVLKHGPDRYGEKLSLVRTLQDSVFVVTRQLESVQQRLDKALKELRNIELEFLKGD